MMSGIINLTRCVLVSLNKMCTFATLNESFSIFYTFMSTVKANDTVKVHYTGRLTDGQVFDSSEGREPLEFTLGQGQLIPGFEKGVLGMAVNESKTVEVPVAEGYGDLDSNLVHEVSKDQLPPDMTPEVGMNLVSETPDGTQIPLVVTEVNDATIKVDANHPLAGKDLVFEIQLVEIV